MKTTCFAVLCIVSCLPVTAHDWHRHVDPQFADLRLLTRAEAGQLGNTSPTVGQKTLAATTVQPAVEMVQSKVPGSPWQAAFAHFAPKVRTRSDGRFFYVESDGMPSHNMMVGITAWQQQVPLPHSYFGDNAWRIPLHPAPAATPATIRDRFLRGAIALAANGIPIFNPQNNRGELSQEIGELDQWGGHCGRADDYHYHAAPLHLQGVLGKALPIAYALDGYAIYGLTEPDGSTPGKLDVFNGHETTALGYHYHASMKYPYVNGGFHGEVVEAGGQVDPQPSAGGWREAGTPLKGARITGFTAKDNRTYSLKYEVGGETRFVNYKITETNTVRFDYVDGNGQVKTEVYSQQQRRGGGDRPRREGGGNGGRSNGRGEERPRSENGDHLQNGRKEATALADPETMPADSFIPRRTGNLTLRSPAVEPGGQLPIEFTGDGSSSTLPLEWNSTPAGTKCYAIIMHHLDPEGRAKWYWTLYNIPADVHALPKNVQGIGITGNNSVTRQAGYAPPHSKGPGAKTYFLTLYALSAPVNVSQAPADVSRDVLLTAMKDLVVDSAELQVVYDRTDRLRDSGVGKRARREPNRN